MKSKTMKAFLLFGFVGILTACNSNPAGNNVVKDAGQLETEIKPELKNEAVDAAMAKADSMMNNASKELKMAADTSMKTK